MRVHVHANSGMGLVLGLTMQLMDCTDLCFFKSSELFGQCQLCLFLLEDL